MTPPDRETLARIVQNAMSAVGLGKWHEAVSIAVDELVVLFSADAERVKELESERGLAYVAGLETGRMESLLPTADPVLSGEWRPIETAPRDDDEPILASSTGKVWFQATWDDQDKCWVTFNSYLERDARVMNGRKWEPTVWIPIPPAPTPQVGEG